MAYHKTYLVKNVLKFLDFWLNGLDLIFLTVSIFYPCTQYIKICKVYIKTKIAKLGRHM